LKQQRSYCLKIFFFSIFAFIFSSPGWSSVVRPAAVAGKWYSASANELRAQIETFLRNVKLPALPAKINALIVPHAGYLFCGQTAAYAYKAIADKDYKRVVILAPSHYVSFYGVSSFDVDGYETPLGRVQVDRKIVKTLLNKPLFSEQTMAHLREHAIEVQLPFLQVVLKKFKLVPILIGGIKDEDILSLAQILKEVLNKDIEKTIFIASSDFTHFGPMYGYMPFKKNILDNIKKMDMGAIAFIKENNAKGLLDYFHKTKVTICGIYPIATTLSLLPKEAKGFVLDYTTSGEILADYTNSVSYIAIALDEPELNQEDEENLLKLARFALKYYFDQGYPPTSNDITIKLSSFLREKKGVFVTLKKQGELRGCIGFIDPPFPLYKAIIEASLRAAFYDPRFPPLRQEELNEIKIEISILGPIVPVEKIEEIEIGRDGLIIKEGSHQGLLLPQVATELDLDRLKFLELTCQKAGLSPWAWKYGASIYRFSANVFEEKD
jgi:hypothetical protein